MNEKYLRGLHGHLNIKDDYDTWVNAVSGNEKYLRGLHNHLGIKGDYDSWYSSVWGQEAEPEEVKKKEEFEPASTEAFLAFTPTLGESSTGLGLSSERDSEDPFRFLAEPEQEQLKAFDAYQSAPRTRFEDPVTGGEQAVAVPESFQLATREAADVLGIQREADRQEAVKQQEELTNQAIRSYKLNPLNNLVFNAVDATVENMRNTLASKVATRKDVMNRTPFAIDREAEQLSTLVQESEQQQAREKTSQKLLLGVKEENAEKGFFQNLTEGNSKDAFLSLFVDGVYGIVDAPRTAAAFIAGRASGGILTGANVFSNEYRRLIASDPLMTKQERTLHAMGSGFVEGLISSYFTQVGLGLGAIAKDTGERIFKKGVEEAKDVVKSKGVELIKNVGGEGLEEATVSWATQTWDQFVDSSFGKDPDKINWFEVVDAGVLGMVAAGPISGIHVANLPSSKVVGHSVTNEKKQDIDEELRSLVDDYDSETDPDIKKAKRQALDDKLKAFDAIAGMEAEAYETLNEDEATQIMSINRRIANLDGQIERGKDLAGIQYNAEQLAEKKSEREKLYEVKKQIEGKAYSREYAEANKGQLPLFVEDAEGNQVETQAKTTPQEVTEQHKTLEREEMTADEEQQVNSLSEETEPSETPLGVEVPLGVTETDKKGREISYFKTTTEKDGVKTTRFTFNRSDKPSDQRNASNTTPVEAALGGKYELEVPEGLQENGAKVVAVKEIRESESGASATVVFEQDGGRFEGEVVLKPKKGASFELDTEAMAEERSGGFSEFEVDDMTLDGFAEANIPTTFHEELMTSKAASENALRMSGTKVVFHEPDSYARNIHGLDTAQEMVDTGDFSFGYFDPESNVIHLYDYTQLDYSNSDIQVDNISDTVRHEFIHAGLASIIGQDADSRARLYEELEGLAETDQKFQSIIDSVERRYPNADAKQLQEEAIREFLQDYSRTPSKYKGRVQRIIDAIKSVFNKYGVNLQVNDETDLLNLAKKFDSAIKTKKSLEVKKEQETQVKKEGRKSKPFTYLNQAEIFYTYNPAAKLSPESAGDFTINRLAPRHESVRVNDYNHFKNWYNKMTGNGRVRMIDNMYHVVDGKRRAIKPPKPRLNKDGSVMYMDLPLSPLQRRMQEAQRKREEAVEKIKAVNAARKQAFDLMDEFGLDYSRVPVKNFMPREEGMTDEEFNAIPETPEMFEAAARNIQALMESGFDPKESYKKSYPRSENVEMYTMADADYVTPQEQMVDDLTKPDSEGNPREIGSGRFSKPELKGRSLSSDSEKKLSEAVEAGKAGRISKDEMDGKPFKAHGYDKTLNGDFGTVNLGKYFSVSLNSGVNNTGILSSASAERGKAMESDMAKAVEEARAQGLDELLIVYTAQDEKHITGNRQVFKAALEFILDYNHRAASATAKTDSERERAIRSVNRVQLIRLKAFFEKSGGAAYVRGSELEPGVVEALKVALPKFMAESNNPDYIEFLERNEIGPGKKNEKLVIPGPRSKNHNINDYNTLASAINELGQSRKIGEYLAPLRDEYKEVRSKAGKKGDIPYLEGFFGFRIAVIDALMSPTDGFYRKNEAIGATKGGHPSKDHEGLKTEHGRALGAEALKRLFVNPLLADFKPGEIMAAKIIKIEEGKPFKVEDRSVEGELRAFPFELTQEGADSESSLIRIPDKRYHYLDFDSDKVISLFEGYYDEAILNISEEVGVDINEVKKSELYKASRAAASLAARQKTLDSLSRIGQSGFSGMTKFGPQFSMLIGMKKREMVSPDSHVSGDGQVNMQGRFSRPDFVTTKTDDGETWNLRTRTSIQEWKDKWLIRLQDKYRGVFLLQQDVEAFKGRSVKESQDFKMAEETMYGKAANDLRLLDERLEQITDQMKSSKVTVDELSEYLYALHAEERNKVIEERTDGEIKDGSGITTEEANYILDSYTDQKKEALDGIVSLIRDMQQDTRDTMVKFGLETQEAIDAFEQMFSNYIPLSGLATDEDSSVSSAYPTGGAGLSVFGDQTKRAKGRKTRAENVLAQAVAQNASVHIEARKNEAMNALYNLVKNNPNPKVWRVVDSANALDPHTVSVRVNGEQKFIRFRDASYARALKNMNVPQTNQFIRLLRMPSNWLRAAFTTQNPEFLLSNFSRDIQSAVFNAAAESEIEGGFLNGERAMKDMFSKVGPALKALLRDATGREQKADPTIMRYYEEYQEDGGKTGWAYMKPLDEIASQLEGEAGEKTRTQEILGTAKNVLGFVEGVNDAFENSIRLAAYIAARENGVSRGKAAQFAKNITVNFNKHGEWGQALNAVYLFFNASVQGTARLGRSLTGLKPPVKPDGSERAWYERATTAQKMAAGLTVFNGMLTMLGMAMSGEDEDGELYWTKIPDYVKERNLVIMRPDGKNYFKIPMPYGFNVFANMGTAAVEGAAGTRDFGSGAMFVASSFINSFSPISFGQSDDLSTKAIKSIVPTPIKPLVDIATNETYFGSPVYAKRWDDSVPESSMSFRSPESVKSFFSWLNDATGGSQDVPGAVDVNPDKLWYTIEYFMGGPGLFIERTTKTVRRLNASVINKEDVDIGFNDVPMLRIIYGEPSKYYDMEKYSDRKNLLKGLKAEMKRTRDFDNPRYQGVKRLDSVIKLTERNLKKIRKQRKEARNIKDFGKRTAEVQRLMDLERKEIMRFNKLYSELRKD